MTETIDQSIQMDWQACMNHFSKLLPEQQFRTWVQPLALKGLQPSAEGVLLRLLAPNRFKQSWAKDQLSEPLKHWWSSHLGQPVDVEILLMEGAPDREDGQLRSSAEPSKERVLTTQLVEPIGEQQRAIEATRLNLDWSFENFVVGKANQLARAAAMQVAENPGTAYNPLFLYGGVGLGKSHLIHAIGNELLGKNRSSRIRYIHAEAYVSDVVRAYQRKAFDDLKSYYHGLDLLLIDDIQFFAGKSRTQEEFFYTFEALIASKKQIIITSDTYPSELNGIESRLVSRFSSGLTVAIEPPELEMRVAILLRKAQQENLKLKEEDAFFIAQQLRSNVRELEGALRKIIAYCHFHQTQPNAEVVREALKDLLFVHKTSISVESIQKTVADFYKIKIADMYSKRRPANIAMPRQIAMYLTKELTQKSLPDIGELFGGRDHTTVLHAVRKINEQRQRDTELNRSLHLLEQQIRG
jgi:chromosomal replication initiator protein